VRDQPFAVYGGAVWLEEHVAKHVMIDQALTEPRMMQPAFEQQTRRFDW
jgi:hypothetical protein